MRFFVGLGGLFLITLALAFPSNTTPIAAAAGKPIFVTNFIVISNFVYVFPKATNYVTVTNLGPFATMNVKDMYISKVVTN